MRPAGVLLDMDGVIYRDDELVPGADALIRRLQEEHIPFLFCTNNTEKHPTEYRSKLEKIGIHVDASSIYSAAHATAEALASRHAQGNFFTLGTAGFKRVLREHGLDVAADGHGSIDGVVIGELRQLDYGLLCQAVNAVTAGTPLYGSNPDILIPSQEGSIIGCGAIAGMVAKAAGAAVHFFGKPALEMIESAAARLGVHCEGLLVIGDNLQTDIAMARAAGVPSILTLSGLTEQRDIERSPYKPDRVIDSVAKLREEPLEYWPTGIGNVRLG